MKTFLEVEGGYFSVYSGTFTYIGFLIKRDGIWTCCPERRVEDLAKDIIEGVDEILEVLNSS